jgi:sugar-specific transcriptional regulator TrmB
MDDEDVVGLLQELGLTAYQSRAYVAAVRLGTGRPNELAESAEIPQARIYDVIDDLADMSFVEVHEKSGGKTVTAPPPETVLASFKERHISEYTETVDSITSRLDDVYDDETSSDAFVTLVGMRESALRHARQVIEGADYWASLSLNAVAYERLREAIEAALDRGVTVRILLEPEAVDACTFPPGLEVSRHDIGETIAVADRAHGVFGAALHDTFQTDFVVSQEPALSTLFQDYFEWLWWDAESVVGASGFPRRYLDPWRVVLDLGADLTTTDYRATVSGVDAATGRSVERAGVVSDWSFAADTDGGATIARATLTLVADSEEFTVGGPREDAVDVVARGLELDHVTAD